MGDNSHEFYIFIKSGLSKTEAAWKTWTGQQAKKNGFTNAVVTEVENGVTVSFTK